MSNQIHIVLGLDAAELINRRAKVVFPLPLTAPAYKSHEAETVAEVVYVFRGTPDILKANRVQAHVFYIVCLNRVADGVVAQENIISPAGTAHKHRLAVDLECTLIVVLGIIVFDAADTEIYHRAVCGLLLAIGNKLELHGVHLGRTHAVGPPQTRIVDMQVGTFYRTYIHGRCLTRLECHLLGKSSVFISTLEGTSKRLFSCIGEICLYKKVGFGKSLCIDAALHYGLRYGHAVGYMYPYGAVHTHALVGRTWVPVHKANVRLAVLGAVHKQRERVVLFT